MKILIQKKGWLYKVNLKDAYLLHNNMQRLQRVSKVSVQRTDDTVQWTVIWAGIRSETFHNKNDETNHCASETHRSPPGDLLIRHSVATL